VTDRLHPSLISPLIAIRRGCRKLAALSFSSHHWLAFSTFQPAISTAQITVTTMPAIPSAKERSRNAVVSYSAPNCCLSRPNRPLSLQAQKAHRERKRAYLQQLEDKLRYYESTHEQGAPSRVQDLRVRELEEENAALRMQVEALKAERTSPATSPTPSPSSSLDSLTAPFPFFGACNSTDPRSAAAAANDSASAALFALERPSRTS
jgi:hypothetical protein